MSAMSESLGGARTILLPGLNFCVSLIQAAIFSAVLSSTPAAMVFRLPTWVRSGPIVPRALVPLIVWQATQAFDWNGCAPRWAGAATGSAAGAGRGADRIRDRGGRLLTCPSIEIIGGVDKQAKLHVCVLESTELNALAVE